MSQRAYDKKCIALSQLESALRCYWGGDYIAAITLAGAAEEIFGRCLQRLGRQNALASLETNTATMHKHLFGEPLDPKWVAERANHARNALKHLDAGGYPTVTIDTTEEAVGLLTRAIDNYWRLESSLTPAMEQFERDRRTPPQPPFSAREDA